MEKEEQYPSRLLHSVRRGIELVCGGFPIGEYCSDCDWSDLYDYRFSE